MNWKELNEQCPQAFLEWVNNRGRIKSDCVNLEWVRDIKGASHFMDFHCNARRVNDSDIWQLPEYFDALGIHVFIEPPIFSISFMIRVFAENTDRYWLSCEGWRKQGEKNNSAFKHFPTRREALEAGVIKAFRIRDEQLKQKEK